MVQAGIDVVIKVADKPIAGQQNAKLLRSMSPIEITNKINGTWQDYLGGPQTWRIKCDGIYVLNAESLQALEDAFMNNEELDVNVKYDNQNYFGRVLITDFPVSSTYNVQFKYNLTLLGTGELRRENA